MSSANSNEKIYEILKKRIIRLEYNPSQVLNETDIASEFDISRTPVRKIFDRLKNDKLLNIIPRFGAQVAPIDFRYMKSVFEVLRELEGHATGLAVDRLSEEKIQELEQIVENIEKLDIEKDYKKIVMEDERFHEIIFESCENPCLIEILHSLHIHTERLWFYSRRYITNIKLFTETLPKIIEAIKLKDKIRADISSKEHIDIFLERIKQELL
jgi:DNA-binding GntR family transcriptional regulator